MGQTLIVQGLGKRLDGEYPCDLVQMLNPGAPECLTYREGRTIKEMTGIRGGEILGALGAGDLELELALAVVILARAGKTLDWELVLDSPAESKLVFKYDTDKEDAEDDPPVEPATTPELEKPSPSGGESTTLTLAPSENGQSPTGPHDSETSAVFDQLTSAT